MQVTTIDHYLPDTGELVVWKVDAAAARQEPSPIRPSFNQAIHLAAAETSHTWLAGTFDVSGSIDREALARAFHDLIARHGTLHSSFAQTTTGVERYCLDPAGLRVVEASVHRPATPSEMRDVLRTQLNINCQPFGFPAYLLGAIDRADRSTVVCGFDHAHVDAYSISIVIDDLHRLYTAHRDQSEVAPDELPMCGNFIDYCLDEQHAPSVSISDYRMRDWLRFFEASDGALPTFPLDLGVPQGDRAPQRTTVQALLGDTSTAAFAQFCRRNGTTVFGGALSAMADAVRRLGGGPELATIFPMHTRREDKWLNAVGWFTTNAPVRLVGTGDLTTTARRTGPALRRAIRLGEIPVPQVISSVGGFRQHRSDVFMVSYLDYRSLPGARLHETIAAHHISNVSTADDAQFWISRTDRGLALRTRYPDTDRARRVMDAFVDDVCSSLRNAATGHRVSGADRVPEIVSPPRAGADRMSRESA